MRLFCFTLLLGLSISGLMAQSNTTSGLRPCAVTERSPWIDAYQRGEIAAVRSSETLVMPLRLHIVGTTGGDGHASLNNVLASINLMQEDFANTNIVFYIDGEIDYINNSSFYQHSSVTTGSNMMALNNDANVINVYFVDDPADAEGYALLNPSSGFGIGLAIANGVLNGSNHVMGHEMGHFLTLPHTFDGWEGQLELDLSDLPTDEKPPISVGGRLVEKVDGSNCNEAGDGFCDTPPDYVSERWTCNQFGFYRDSLIDPDSTKFAVPGYPIMGYANDVCVDRFTDEQTMAMVTNASVRSSLLRDIEIETEPADANQITLLESSGNIEAVDEISIPLRWTSTPDADFYIVQLSRSPFFGSILHDEFAVYDTVATVTADNDIELNTRYYWRIRPVNKFKLLSGTSGNRNFRVTDIVSSTQDPSLSASLNISPNPVNVGRGHLNLRLAELSSNATMEVGLFGADGRQLYRHLEPNVGLGSWTHDIPVSTLPAGVYFLRLQAGNRLATRRIVVTQ